MVDIDDLREESGNSGSKSGSSSSSGSGKAKDSGSGDVGSEGGTYSLDDEDILEPGDKTMSRTSKEWADEHGNLNYDSRGGEDIKDYMKRQVKEVEELHENIREMANKNNENFEQFTLYMHTMLLNFAQNRVGIMETIKEQYGKTDREAIELTNKICEKAGEGEFVENMVRDITENLADL